VTTFDLARHQRERIRRLEAELTALRDHRDRLERMLALALQMATHDSSVSPTALLAVLEELDKRVNESPNEKVLRVLRETSS
jgi:predicted RNase H-like nuclease (RuvC/YqgF family)